MRFPQVSDIRKIRKMLDISQTSLAKESGVSQSTIAKIETGRISASYSTVVSLFETLDRLQHDSRKDATASDVYSTNVMSIQSGERIRNAMELMKTTGFSQLPVFTDDRPVGSISERKIFGLLKDGRTMDELKDIPISNIMDESFPAVSESTSITTLSDMLSSNDAVLVMKKGKVIGLVTNADMLKLI